MQILSLLATSVISASYVSAENRNGFRDAKPMDENKQAIGDLEMERDVARVAFRQREMEVRFLNNQKSVDRRLENFETRITQSENSQKELTNKFNSIESDFHELQKEISKNKDKFVIIKTKVEDLEQDTKSNKSGMVDLSVRISALESSP